MLGLAAVAAVLGLAFWGNRKQSPPHRMTPISSIADWQEGYGYVFSTQPYLWLTDHEVFHFNGDTMRGLQADAYDTRTHTETMYPGLSVVQSGHVISASPDGQWVLWDTQKFSNSPPGMAVTHRKDGKTVRWPLQTDRSEGCWLPDNRHWAAITSIVPGWLGNSKPQYDTTVSIFCVDHPGIQKYHVRTTVSPGYILGANPQGHLILNASFSGWGTPGQATPPLSLLEVSLNTNPPAVNAFQVPQPQTPPSQPVNVLLSPQGDRLLWSTFSIKPSTLVGWLSLWTHHMVAGGTESLDVWVCRLDGSPSQHVGTWSGRR